MNNTLVKFLFKKALLKGKELYPQAITELNIYESIVTPTVLGEISIADWQGFHEIEEVFIGDTIQLFFGSEDKEELTLTFSIYASYPGMEPTHTYQPVKYKFCSAWFIDGMTTQVSKVFKEKYIHEIVSDLLTSCGASLGIIEPCLQKLPIFVSPLWTPIKTILHLTSFALNKDNQGNYVFWTDMVTGKVNFTTIDFLYKGKFGKDATKLLYLPKNQLYDGRILNLTFENEFDIINFLNNGGYKTAYQSLNFDKNVLYKFNKPITSLGATHLGKFLPLRTKYTDEKYTNIKGCYNFPNKDTLVVDNKEFENLIDGKAKTGYSRIYSDVFKINVLTNASSSRRVGKLVDLEFQSEDKSQIAFNKKYSGTYLMKNIRHILIRDTYQQVISLISDGFVETKLDVVKW